MRYAKLIATGSYLPNRILTNEEISQKVDTTHEWIVERTGIHQRHIAEPTETASDMAYHATQAALSFCGWSPNAIELIIVSTSTPDKIFPSTACLLQQKLGIQLVPAFDISAACSGFAFALSVADQYIKTGAVKTALVVGSELMSRTVDWQDRRTCVLFGDGAGAVLLGAADEPGIYSTHIHCDGRYKDILYYNGPTWAEQDEISPYMQMDGKEVYKAAVTRLGELVDEALAANGMQQSQIDWLIPHQANLRIIEAIARRLNLPLSQVMLTLKDCGNTSAASIPIALDRGIREGHIKPGQHLLLEAFGGGLAWGAALLKY